MGNRIGIFSGTFDPVHAGHLSFALAAAEEAGLDKVYLLPEQQPRRKEAVTHYAHRIAMLKLALRPYQKLEVLELPDRQFSVSKTLPRLSRRFADDELHMLVGSDMLHLLNSPEVATQWPDSARLLEQMKLIVGVRTDVEFDDAKELIAKLQQEGVVVKTDRPHVSSRDIRQALMQGQEHVELLGSLRSYISENWLYTSVLAAPNNS